MFSKCMNHGRQIHKKEKKGDFGPIILEIFFFHLSIRTDYACSFSLLDLA